MRKFLLSLLSLMCIVQYTLAQPATYSNPIGLGRGACGSGASSTDSLYYLNYLTPNLSNSATPIRACKPVLRTNFAPLSGYSAANKPFTIFNSSVAFNPADQNIYYVWTDYNVPSPYKSYIWRWDPTTCPTPAAPGLDTLKTFNLNTSPELSPESAVALARSINPNRELESIPTLKILPDHNLHSARLIYWVKLEPANNESGNDSSSLCISVSRAKALSAISLKTGHAIDAP